MTYTRPAASAKGPARGHTVSSARACTHALRAGGDEHWTAVLPRGRAALELGGLAQDRIRDSSKSPAGAASPGSGVQRYVEDRPTAEARAPNATCRPHGTAGGLGRVDRLDEPTAELSSLTTRPGVISRGPTTSGVPRASPRTRSRTRGTLRRDCHLVELHHLPSGRVVAWRHTDEAAPGTCGRGGGDRRRTSPTPRRAWRPGTPATAAFLSPPGPTARGAGTCGARSAGQAISPRPRAVGRLAAMPFRRAWRASTRLPGSTVCRADASERAPLGGRNGPTRAARMRPVRLPPRVCEGRTSRALDGGPVRRFR